MTALPLRTRGPSARGLGVVLLALLSGACSPPVATPPRWETEPEVGPPPVTEHRSVTLLAMNDLHGALYEQPVRGVEGRTRGGLPILAGALDALRAEVPDLVLLDGGDLFQGSWPVNQTRGLGGVAAFELLGVEVATLGNHEFDYGPSPEGGHPLRGALERALVEADYAYVSANIFQRGPDGTRAPWLPPDLAPWTVVERRGVRLGVIGLTTVETPETTLRRNVVDLEFADPVETVRGLLPELEAAGVDAVIVVGHLTGTCAAEGTTRLFGTTEACRRQGEIGRLVDELPPGAVDVIVAGHEHILIADRVRNTFVLEAMSHGRALVRLDLAFGPDGFDPDASVLHEPWVLEHAAVEPGCEGGAYPLTPLDVGGREVTPNASAVALVERLEGEAGSLCEVLGCAADTLWRSHDAESPLGNFVADALLASSPDVDLALQNSGGLRADLNAGEVRREDLQAVMPFDNRYQVVELTGEALIRLFRIGSSGAHGVLQVAGASYRFDPTVESGSDLDADGAVDGWELDRLCWVRVGGEPVDPEATYRVGISDFLHGGGDHLGPVLSEEPIVFEGALVREALYEYTRRQTSCAAATSPIEAAAARIEVGPCGD